MNMKKPNAVFATFAKRELAAYVGGFEITILNPLGIVLSDVPTGFPPVVKVILVLFNVEKSMFSLNDALMNVLTGTLVAPLVGPVELTVGATVSVVKVFVVSTVGVADGVFALYPISPG
jgi:hypothetical protein